MDPTTDPPGGPTAIDPELRRLIVRVSRENPTWGYRRVHGEVHRLGHAVAASTVSTVSKVLRAAGIDPRRDRTGPTRSESIRSQAKAIIAPDFACRHRSPAPVPRPVRHRGSNPRSALAGITANPTGPWANQAARNLLMRLPDNHEFRFLVRDDVGQFTRSFDAVLAGCGDHRTSDPTTGTASERVRRTMCAHASPRNPRPHERLNDQQFRRLLEEYIAHYKARGNHRRLNQRAPDDGDDGDDGDDIVAIVPGQPIRRHTTCGGPINEYRTAA